MLESFFKYFAENKTVSKIILFAIIILGIAAGTHLHRDLFPVTELDRVFIMVSYPGASPEDVELNAVLPIEDKIKSISGIEEYVSVAIEDGARIFIYLDESLDNPQKVKDQIFRDLSNIPELPTEAEMTIIDANPKLKSIYTLGLRIKDDTKASKQKLFDFADQLESGLLKLDGVSSIRKEGYLEPEIHINVIPDKLDKYYVSLNEIVDSIKAENVRATGGTLQGVSEDKTIVTIGQFPHLLDVKNVIIRSSYDGKRLYIKDVANVVKGFEESDVDVRINKSSGLAISVVKKENADIIKTTNNIKEFLKANQSKFPKDFEITTMGDESLSIIALLDVVKWNAILGFILVFVILLLFLDKQSAFWTAFGIPVIVLMLFIYLYSENMTLNLISLGAIVTIMGILVDDGIIISENIYRYKLMGFSGFDATLKGIKEVASPVLVAVTTTIVAFMPMLMIKGMMGKMIHTFPIVITAALVASLFEAFFLLPNHLLHAKQNTKQKKKTHWFEPVSQKYETLLKAVIKMRYFVLVAFLLIFAGTLFFMSKGMKNFVLTRNQSSDQINVNMETPLGTSRKETVNQVSKIEEIILNTLSKNEFFSIKTTIGHHDKRPFNMDGYHDNWAQTIIYLVPVTERKKSADKIIKEFKQKVTSDLKEQFSLLTFDKRRFGPDVGKGIEINVIGNNDTKSKKLTSQIKDYLKTIDGITDIEDSLYSGKKEIQIIFNKEMLAKINLNVSTVAQTVRMAFHGEIATTKRSGNKDIAYRVVVSDDYKKDIGYLKNLLIRNTSGNLIKLEQIAHFEETRAPLSITHYNGDKTVSILGNIDINKTTPKKVMEMVTHKFSNYVNQKYADVYIDFEGEAKETKRSMKELFIAFGIAIVFIYFILSLLFKSAIQPVMIIILIPFGIMGGLIALILHNMPLGFMSMIGLIGLMGVVVNDNVVMVDYINRIQSKADKTDKITMINLIASGAKIRLRPIVLTTLTTVLGLLPAVYGIGGTSETIQPVVTVLAYGLLFDTVLTLFFLPSLYMIVSDIKKTNKTHTRDHPLLQSGDV